MNYIEAFQHIPLIAILRGIVPDQAVAVGKVLIEAGFCLIEIPLNSREAFKSIELLSQTFKGQSVIGGGTVLTPNEVSKVQKAGGTFIVSPNCDQDVIKRTKECGMVSLPGIATASEAFAALKYGADALKIFPAELFSAKGLKALLSVLPKGLDLIPVGSIDYGNMREYQLAGASGFGFGSSLFKPEYSLLEIQERADKLMSTYKNLNCTKS